MSVAIERARAISQSLERLLKAYERYRQQEFDMLANWKHNGRLNAFIRDDVTAIAAQMEGLLTILEEIEANDRNRYHIN